MSNLDTTISLSTFQCDLINRIIPASSGKVVTITGTAGNMYEIKATTASLGSETYIVNKRAEAEELAMELRARQYIVEVSELDPED